MKAGIERPDELLHRNYWTGVHGGHRLPQTFSPRAYPDYHRLFCRLLPHGGPLHLLEVGCAPGRWLAYFSRHHGYLVSGLDYDEVGCEITRRNLELLNVDADVMNCDLFAGRGSAEYNIVFSNGFIEHFEDPSGVVNLIVSHARPGGFVVTIVPNLDGVGGLVSKIFRPSVYRGHRRIGLGELTRWHRDAGIDIFFSGYAGGIVIPPPMEKNAFSAGHPRLSTIANLPFRVFNLALRRAESALGLFPRSRRLSPALIVMGRVAPV